MNKITVELKDKVYAAIMKEMEHGSGYRLYHRLTDTVMDVFAKAQIEDKAGLDIKCKECADNVTCKAYLNSGGFHSDGGVCAHFHPSPKPTTYEEWRKTLSPEEQDESDRELARLVREHESDKPTESLAELADRELCDRCSRDGFECDGCCGGKINKFKEQI